MWDGGLRVSIGDQRLYGTDENGCEWLVNGIDGVWDGVGSTHQHSSRVWDDGWFANRSARNGRSITLSGYMTCPSQGAFEASRQALLAAIGLDDVTLIVDAYGTKRMYTVRQDSDGPKIAVSGYHAWKFSIPLVSLSPYAFDAGGPLSGSTGLAATSGGMRFPAAFTGPGAPGLVSSWCFIEATVSGEVNLTNPGGAPSPVTLRVDGPVDGPRVEHQPSGGVLELGLSLGLGHYVLFDSQSRQVLVDGRDPARGAVLRRGWSDALPGANTWSFTAKGSSPGARLTVSFRPAYL